MSAIAQETPSPASSWRRRGYVAGAVAAALLFLWEEMLLAWPVVGLTKLIGAGPTFVSLTPVYFAVSAIGALLVVRAYDRASGGQTGRLERWLSRQTESPTGRSGRRLVNTMGGVGFVLASVLIGGILTTWLVRVGGRRDRLVSVALLSSALFAVGFVGGYSGLFGLIFG